VPANGALWDATDSKITFTAVAGQNYWVIANSFEAATGVYNLMVSQGALTEVPVNFALSAANPLTDALAEVEKPATK
jgi:hypothetical protein